MSSTIDFTKMHGLGNDFMVIDNLARDIELDAARIRTWADRHTGIGFDQLLIVEPPSDPAAQFDYRIFNADGGEVEHCGNGARCFARFVLDRGLTHERVLHVKTGNGLITLQVLDDGNVTVQMGVPTFVPELVPFIGPYKSGITPWTDLHVDGETLQVGVAGIGNPHVVLLVDDVATAEVDRLGPLLEAHSRFPKRVNVGFLQVIDTTRARLRVFERGVGETRACGSGACAAMAIGQRAGLLGRRVRMELTGGSLDLHWPGDADSVAMTGPCSTVFEGQTRM